MSVLLRPSSARVRIIPGKRPLANMEYLSDAKRIVPGITEDVKGVRFVSSMFLFSGAALHEITQLLIQVHGVNNGGYIGVSPPVTNDNFLTGLDLHAPKANLSGRPESYVHTPAPGDGGHSNPTSKCFFHRPYWRCDCPLPDVMLQQIPDGLGDTTPPQNVSPKASKIPWQGTPQLMYLRCIFHSRCWRYRQSMEGLIICWSANTHLTMTFL